MGGTPAFGTIAKTVDMENWYDGESIGELGWRMCSEMAHGREWSTLDVLHRQFVRQVANGISEVRLTAGMSDISVMAQLAYTMLTEAVNLLSIRSRAHY
ncbi:UNVERIFIED_ORG: hypothetical protein ABIB21_003068 [Arthrobacter sp. UYEF13]